MSPRLQLFEDIFFILMGIGTAGLCLRCIGYWMVMT